MVYSAFDSDFAARFSMNYLIFNMLGLLAIMYKWYDFSKSFNKDEIYKVKDLPLLVAILNSPEWNIKSFQSKVDMEDNLL